MWARTIPDGDGSDQVFLNVPYNKSYEHRLVALTVALVSIGRTPLLACQVPEIGQGRLSRIFELLKDCPVSIHDLSAVGGPARFNMPFELGIACAIREHSDRHEFVVFEKRPHQLLRYLSDLNGIDPRVHHGTISGTIRAVLDAIDSPHGNPNAASVLRLYRRMIRYLPTIKCEHATTSLFSIRTYGDLVWLSGIVSREMKISQVRESAGTPILAHR